MIMPPVSTNIKIDPAIKQQSQEVLESFGLSLSAAVNIFLRQVIREQAIPFRIGEPAPDSKTEYFQKLDRGLEQVKAGQGINKTLKELEAMATDEG